MLKKSERKRKHLIDLLIVVAVVAIIASVTVGVFAHQRNKAELSRCISNLKKCGRASLMYCEDNDGRFAPARITDRNGKVICDWAEGQCVGGQAGRLAKDGVLGDHYTPAKYRPLNKYVESNEVFRCPSEKPQMLPGDYEGLAWKRFGSSYLMNVTFAYPVKGHLFYTLNRHVGRNQFTGIRLKEVGKPKRMIMMAGRSVHYWNGVPASALDLKPLDDPPISGHSGRRPWAPVVFCDGHTEYIKMTPGISGENWDLAQPEWLQHQ